MTTAKQFIGAFLALVLVVIVGSVAYTHVQAPKAGTTNQVGYLQQLVSWFTNTVYFGTEQQMSIDASGNIVTTGTITSAAGAQTSTSETINGVTTTYYRSSSMNTASTTNCSLGPITATSTLESFTSNTTAGTTTASTLTLATSTSPSASTSPIASKTVAANGQATLDWHPTAHNSLIFPGTYINQTQAGNIGTFSNTGTCNAVVRSVN